MSRHTIAECLEDISITDSSIFSECESLEQEFAAVKKVYFRKVLREHPDKGGDAEEFRKTQSAFQVIRELYQNGKIKQSLGSYIDPDYVDDEDYEDLYNTTYAASTEVPSYEHFEEAAEENVPGYRVELAKSNRSQCVKCKKDDGVKRKKRAQEKKETVVSKDSKANGLYPTEDLTKLKVTELKRRCKFACLDQSGRKAQLIKRLKAYYATTVDHGDNMEEKASSQSKLSVAKDAEESLEKLKVVELKERCEVAGLEKSGRKAELIERLRNHYISTKRDDSVQNSVDEKEVEDLTKLKVVELKERCEVAGLEQKGRKAELVERLKNYYCSENKVKKKNGDVKFEASQARSTTENTVNKEENLVEATSLRETPRIMTTRSSVALTSNTADNENDSKGPSYIEKTEMRVGSMDAFSGAYGRWHHLDCWRVPYKVWSGFTQPEDERLVLRDLLFMNEVLLEGVSELKGIDQAALVKHCMDRSNWAKQTKRSKRANIPNPHLASKPVTSNDDDDDDDDDGKPASKRMKTEKSLVNDIKGSSTAVVKKKEIFVIPKPGQNGVMGSDFLAGKTFVCSGIFPEVGGGAGLNLGKDKVKAMIVSFGGRVTSAISGKTDYLLIGKEPGETKVKNARSRKLPMIDVRKLKSILMGETNFESITSEPPPKIESFSAGYPGVYRIGY